MDCTYIIKTKLDITQAMLDDCIQTSVDNLRTSNDGLLAVLKWSGVEPAQFAADTKYTHAQILTEMGGVNWVSPEL